MHEPQLSGGLRILSKSHYDCQLVPVKEISISVKICGFVSDVEAELLYKNESPSSIETAFTFPVDDEAAVYHFEADIGGRKIIAECQEKKQAKQTYKDAVSYGHSAFLMHEDDHVGDIFICKLGNLPANSEAKIRFRYAGVMNVEGSNAEFVLPTILNPRYSSGNAKGASKYKGEQIQKKYQINFTCDVESDFKVADVTSEKDKLKVTYFDDKHTNVQVSLARPFVASHDLNLKIHYENLTEPCAVIERGDPDKGGILADSMLMLNFCPDLEAVEDAGVCAEYVFIVDCSGSMMNEKIKSAAETLRLLVASLPVGCFFNIVRFGSSFESLFEGENGRQYDEQSYSEACSLIKVLDADMGGTEILQPMKSVCNSKVKAGYPRQVFLLTDGEVWDTNTIIKKVKEWSANGNRFFTVGIGDGASTSLVKGVARAGRGKAEFVLGKDRLQAKVMQLLKCAMQPVLSDVSVKLDLAEAEMTAVKPMPIPCTIPNAFCADRYVIYMLLKAPVPDDTTLILEGLVSGEKRNFKVPLCVQGNISEPAPIHRLAAKTQITELEDGEENAEDNKPLIVLVSTAANVVSKYTAFVGVDKTKRHKTASQSDKDTDNDDEQTDSLDTAYPHPSADPYQAINCQSMLCGRSQYGGGVGPNRFPRLCGGGYGPPPPQQAAAMMHSNYSSYAGPPKFRLRGGCQSPGKVLATKAARKSAPCTGSVKIPPRKKRAKDEADEYASGCEDEEDIDSSTSSSSSDSEEKPAQRRSKRIQAGKSSSKEIMEKNKSTTKKGQTASKGKVQTGGSCETKKGKTSPKSEPVKAKAKKSLIKKRKGEEVDYSDSESKKPRRMSRKEQLSVDLMSVIDIQKFDGSWDLNANLAKLFNVTLESIKKSCPVQSQKVWATALALAFLDLNFKSQKVEWEAASNKAFKWLKRQNKGKHSENELVQLANTFLSSK